MRLHIDPIRTEQLLGPLDGQCLGHIHKLAATVVALARVALGVFVGQHASLRLHHADAGVVFRGNQFKVVLLAASLGRDGRAEFRIKFIELRHRSHGLLSVVHGG